MFKKTSFSRRKFLAAASVASAGAMLGLLTACAPAAPAATPTPTTPPAQKTSSRLLIFGGKAEITEKDISGYQQKYPQVQIDLQEPDGEKLRTLLAAGTPPDVIRTDGAELQNFLLRAIPLDVSDFLLSSAVLKVKDFAPSCEYYHIQGKWYGIPKDWSPDFSFFGNAAMIKAAGLTPPPFDRSIRYAELFELARKLTQKEGERTVVAGYAYESAFFARQIMAILLEEDQYLYSEDFGQIQLKKNELAMQVLGSFSQIAKEGVTWSALNPSQNGTAQDYLSAKSALAGYGYWFSAMINNPASSDAKVDGKSSLFFPAATWTGKKTVNPTIGGSGYIAARQSKNPETAWTFLEWYLGDVPARERASSGWGVPALKSLYALMPQTNDFQKQVQTVLQHTFENGDADFALKFNPYYSDQVFNASWNKNLESVLKGTSDLQAAVEAMEAEVNAAIAAGKRV
jgi:multiple sugar transport system substrate-binding protein